MTEDSPPKSRGPAAEKASRRGRTERRMPIASSQKDWFGSRYDALQAHDVETILAASLDILATIGVADASHLVIETIVPAGGSLSSDGRLLFPEALVRTAIAGLSKSVLLAGRLPQHDLRLEGRRVYAGTGGAAPFLIDMETETYRPSTLRDLYDAARLVDALEHVHFFSRSVVARDMETPHALALNTAFASMAGTAKHVMVSADHPDQVSAIADMCYRIAGSGDEFRRRPFLSLNINHVTPPLRLSQEAFAVMATAIDLGIPVHVNTFGQMGASSPVTLAGCLAQTTAETLAGLVFAWLRNPEVKAIMGMRPMVTDLRTGGMAGGGGEQALLTAASIQIAQHLGLPNSTIAGAADSKISDAQSGYEKALTVSLAAQAGCNMITQACGMQAGLMGCSFESYVIDNDMIGSILSSLAPIEVSDRTLALASIAEVVRGEGHFLGQSETLQRMNSDFVYPRIADRRGVQEWERAGSPDIRGLAKPRAREILAAHFPTYMSADLISDLRRDFDIRLPDEHMRVG